MNGHFATVENTTFSVWKSKPNTHQKNVYTLPLSLFFSFSLLSLIADHNSHYIDSDTIRTSAARSILQFIWPFFYFFFLRCSVLFCLHKCRKNKHG